MAVIYGNGSSPVIGTPDDDEIFGAGNYSEDIRGLAGDDTIHGNGGTDTLSGGDGDDVFDLTGYYAEEIQINGGAGFDTLVASQFVALDYSKLTSVENIDLVGPLSHVRLLETQVLGAGGFNKIAVTGDDYDNILVIGTTDGAMSASNLLLVNWDADDTLELWGSDRSDLIFGSQYNDHLIGFGGGDTMRGGLGDDQLSGWDDDLLLGGAGNDSLQGEGADTLIGGEGDDVY